MRRLAVLALLLSAPAVAQRAVPDLEHHEPTAALDSLRGPVRSVRYRHIDGGVIGPNQVTLVNTYDRAGRRAELLAYRADDLRSRLVYTYDERGRHTGWESYEVPRSGGPHMPSFDSPPGTPLPTVPERLVYVLDEAGRRTEEHTIGPNGGMGRRAILAYDSAGRLRESVGVDAYGRPGGRVVHEYDAAGRLRERRMYYDDQEFRTVFAYDEHGNFVLEENRDGARRLDWRWAVRYDSAGRKREEQVHEGGQPRWRVEYRYDDAGRLSEQETHDLQPHLVALTPTYQPGKVTYTYLPGDGRAVETARYGRDGSLTERVVDRFDAAGRRVEREEFEPDGTRTPKRIFDPVQGQVLELMGRTRWTEELDAHGNWVRRGYILIPDDGSPPVQLWEIVREIDYW